jgi:serine/threonine protein kinase
MEKYKIQDQLGDGTYGTVIKAINIETSIYFILNFSR